jgi:transposase
MRFAQQHLNVVQEKFHIHLTEVSMSVKKYDVKFNHEQRQQLLDLIQKGHASARMITRARILLLASEGRSDDDIANNLHTSLSTVVRVRKSYCTAGLDESLTEKKRSGAPAKLDGKAEAKLTAIACSTPPEGHSRWTLRLLADKVVELELVDTISHVTIGNVLKKTN